MSIAYPATLNQIIVHQLAYPRGGAVQIENNTNLFLYVALTYRGSVSDIIAQNIMTVPPYGTNTRTIIPGSFSPVLSMVPTDLPYAIAATVNNSQPVIRVNEYSDPKAAPGAESGGVVIADYLVVAGGLIKANQQGLYTTDQAGHEVLAVNLDAGHVWDSKVMANGDLMIGRGSNYLYWVAATGELIVTGTINVTGGAAYRVTYVGEGLAVTGPNTLSWGNLKIGLSDGTQNTIPASSAGPFTVVQYILYDKPGNGLTFTGATPGPLDLIVGKFIPGTIAGTLYIFNGGTLISGDRIVTGSIDTDNLRATAIDGMLITGAVLRTNAATYPDVQIDASGVTILADALDHVQWLNSDGTQAAFIRGVKVGTLVTTNRLQLNTGNACDIGEITLGVRRTGSSANRASLTLKTSGADGLNHFNLSTLVEYADNSAAVTAGLSAGDLYRTGDLVKVVH